MQESGVDLEFDILNDIIEEFQPKVGFYEIQSRTLDDVIRYLYDFLCFEKPRDACACMQISFLGFLSLISIEHQPNFWPTSCIQKGRKYVLLFA